MLRSWKEDLGNAAAVSVSMKAISLDDVIALNDQLGLLVQAGVPLDLGPGSAEEIGARLDRINASVARRVHEGVAMADALAQDDPDIPDVYRGIVRWGLLRGSFQPGLASSYRLAVSSECAGRSVCAALFYPLLVCALAGMGLIGLCLVYVPSLEGMYELSHAEPGKGLRILQGLRSALPYWMVFPPAALALLVGWSVYVLRDRGRSVPPGTILATRVTGATQSMDRQRCAAFADALADLLETEVPLPDALPIAADLCGEEQLSSSARWLARELGRGAVPGDGSPELREVPPLLRWALLHGETASGQAAALRLAAGSYRESARQVCERLETIGPPVLAAVLGGGAVLLYGLAVFLPAVELLHTLAD